jgi:predicted lipid-binding transport protein (Tim44 family)
MSNNFGYIDIILLAMIAGFIILRLRNILGRKTGHEENAVPGFSDKKFDQFKKDLGKSSNQNDSEETIKEEFLKGAEVAYETIITAFAKGDKKNLKALLSPKMQANFSEAIDLREKNNIKSELTFIGIKNATVEKFEKTKTEFFATVKIVCEIISVKKDKEDKVIEGNPDKIKTVTDYWKFSKSTSSKNPNWYLSDIVSK